MNPRLSVVIPAFNEINRIEPTLRSIERYLKEKKFTSEIIVVDDGSTDGTAELIRKMPIQTPRVLLLQLSENQGKGAAVKAGMLSATGEMQLFMDADGSTDIQELEKLIPYITDGFDVIVGSRLLLGAEKKTKQNVMRELLGWIFRALVRVLTRINVLDPQNGFKLFTKAASERVFTALVTNGWSFDVEVLVLSQKYGLKVKEVPITWVNDGRSKMRFFDMIRMLFDVLSTRKRHILP